MTSPRSHSLTARAVRFLGVGPPASVTCSADTGSVSTASAASTGVEKNGRSKSVLLNGTNNVYTNLPHLSNDQFQVKPE